MARETYEAARRERNAALVETMLLAASADGRIDPKELQLLIARVIERPEFEGTDAEALNAMLEHGAKRLSEAKRLEDVLATLNERLPERRWPSAIARPRGKSWACSRRFNCRSASRRPRCRR
jgi:tellurite resistance protein